MASNRNAGHGPHPIRCGLLVTGLGVVTNCKIQKAFSLLKQLKFNFSQRLIFKCTVNKTNKDEPYLCTTPIFTVSLVWAKPYGLSEEMKMTMKNFKITFLPSTHQSHLNNIYILKGPKTNFFATPANGW